jgi:hypothetical protein
MLLLLIISFILCTKAIIKFIAAFFSRIPLYYRLNNPEVNIIQVIRRVIILLYPFAIYKSKIIGR